MGMGAVRSGKIDKRDKGEKMIVDKIENAALYYGVSEGIELALKFLEKEAKSLEARVQIDGDDVFAFPAAYTSKTREDSL